ncbi:VOC family protein [Erwinia sp. E_sp_B01_3]|uniref:VOC family protein n=2 Tax=Erwinia TaxID=551 RepID=UPI0030D2146B
MNAHGIEHIGITVSDLPTAEQFFINALGATTLYHIVPPDRQDKEIGGESMHPLNGFPASMNVTGLVMMRLGNGCNVELFEIAPPVKHAKGNICTQGVNHFSVYVDDIYEAGKTMRANGARMFEGPSDCFAQEEGKGNKTWFCMTPFGVLIELITLPSGVTCDSEATQKRWIPTSQ